MAQARSCPACSTPLDEVRRTAIGPSVRLDQCANCGGVFLDKHEILRLTGNIPLDRFLRQHRGAEAVSELACPSCGGRMDVEEVAGVHVDVCIDCDGVWLDAEEIDTLQDADPAEFKEMSREERAQVLAEHEESTVHRLVRSLLHAVLRRGDD